MCKFSISVFQQNLNEFNINQKQTFMDPVDVTDRNLKTTLAPVPPQGFMSLRNSGIFNTVTKETKKQISGFFHMAVKRSLEGQVLKVKRGRKEHQSETPKMCCSIINKQKVVLYVLKFESTTKESLYTSYFDAALSRDLLTCTHFA